MTFVGVVLLAIGVFWKSAEDMKKEAGGAVLSGNPVHLKSLVKNQVGTVIGLVFLVSGFSLQILGALKINLQEKYIWSLWVILFMGIYVYFEAKTSLIERQIKRIYSKKTEKE